MSDETKEKAYTIFIKDRPAILVVSKENYLEQWLDQLKKRDGLSWTPIRFVEDGKVQFAFYAWEIQGIVEGVQQPQQQQGAEQ